MAVIAGKPVPWAARAKYPWDEWMDGQCRILNRGEDFQVTPRGMYSAVHAWGRKHGVRVRVQIIGGGRVQVQAFRDAEA
jgi:hypothetical protein